MNDETNYKTSGYDEFLRRDFNAQPETTEDIASIQTPQLAAETLTGNVPKDSVTTALEDSIQETGTSTVSFTLPNGFKARVTSTITDRDNPGKVMFGICETASYETNIGNSSYVIPYGASIDSTDYQYATFYDYDRNQTGSQPGSNLSYTIVITNVSGVSKSIYMYFRWRYLGKLSSATES
jgi:hypothetical protein